jgi:hypothetical protein
MPTTLVFLSESIESSDLISGCLEDLPQIQQGEVVAVGRPGGYLDAALNSCGVLHRLVPPAKLTHRVRREIIQDADYVLGFWDGRTLTDLVFEARVQKKPTKLFAVETAVVVNKDRGDTYDIYIGRGTPWGNPFVVGTGDGRYTREEAVAKYRTYFEQDILTDKSKVAALKAMRGLRLGCHCKPLACHGDVIASYVNRLPAEQVESTSNAEPQRA